MNAFYVFQADGQPTGPYTTEALARAIVDGAVPRDAFVAPAGAAQWLHASQLPEVLATVDAMTRARSTPLPVPLRAVVSVAPAPTPTLAPVAPAEPATPAQPAPQAKPADGKPKPKPWPKFLPAAIFACFAALALCEVVIGLVVSPKAETTETQQ
jgi:hypothetical protein